MSSDWTVDTLREHVDTTLAERDKRLDQRYEAQERAVSATLKAAELANAKAEVAFEKRMDAANEFRAQLRDQASTLMPRAETGALVSNLNDRITRLEARVNEERGHGHGLTDARAMLISGTGLAIAIAAVLVSAFH